MGRWRIAWLGDVAYHEPARTQPSIAVVLQSLDMPSIGRVTEARVPIAQLFALRLGSVWQDGVLTDDVDAQCITRQVDFKTWKVSTRPAGASVSDASGASFLLPFEAHSFHRDHTKTSCLTVEADGRILIFPAMELIRFYFGSSGSLLRRLFSANFEPNVLAERCSMDERRKASLILADDIAGASAQDVARILLNEHAGAAARLISRSLVAGRAGGRADEKVYARTAFPFSGQADLTVEGVDLLVSNGPPRFLVQRLVQCRARFPFSALEYVAASRRSGTSHLRASEAGANGSNAPRRSVQARRPAGTVESREPRSASTRQMRTDSRGRFPDLDSKRVWRSAVDEELDHSGLRGLSTAPYDSTGRGMASADGKRIDLTQDAGARDKLAVLDSPSERWLPYFQFVAALAVQEWVEELVFVRLDPRQEAEHYVRISATSHGSLTKAGATLGDDSHRDREPAWASFVNVRVGGVVSSIASISPRNDDLVNTTWLRPRCEIEPADALQALTAAFSEDATASGWMEISIGRTLPWMESALAVETVRLALVV